MRASNLVEEPSRRGPSATLARTLVGAACVLSACGVAACSSIIGLADIPGVTPGDDASADAATVDASGGGAEASATAEGAVAEGAAGGDGCVASVEICTNGVDDDCNGHVDCDDPACAQLGYACVPEVPAGWTYAAVDRADLAACPAGTTAQELVAAASGAAATCGCTCSTGQLPSCAGAAGQLTAALGSTQTCGDGTVAFQTGGCTVTSLQTAGWVQASPPPPTGGSCVENPSKSVPVLQRTNWRACGTQGPFGEGCAQGEVCAIARGSFDACITQAGSTSCPASYPSAQVVGTGVSDTRDCSACTCGGFASSACSGGTLSFYSDGACSPGLLVTGVSIDGTCNAETPNVSYGSYEYSATPSATCAAPTQMPSATGTVSITGSVTACCVQ